MSHPPAPLQDIYLGNAYRHLLVALLAIAAKGQVAQVIYLEDELPLPEGLRHRLAAACPEARITTTTDAAQVAAFARLPQRLPTVLRRNLSLSARAPWLIRPQDWPSPLLAGQCFATGYVFHAGFFFSKVLAGRCETVVLKESGLHNYITLPVRGLKVLLRAITGLPPRAQVWGEQPWITRIDAARPEDLPAAVRAKGRRERLEYLCAAVPPDRLRAIGSAFLSDSLPDLGAAPGPTALLLTQPLEDIHLCSADEKINLYKALAQRLRARGYRVFLKPHPRERLTAPEGVETIAPHMPIEAWPMATAARFDLAVALRSAALETGASTFAHRTCQLVTPEEFTPRRFAPLIASIPARLDRQLSAPAA